MADFRDKRTADVMMTRWRQTKATTAEMRSSVDRLVATKMLRPKVAEILRARIFLIDHPKSGS